MYLSGCASVGIKAESLPELKIDNNIATKFGSSNVNCSEEEKCSVDDLLSVYGKIKVAETSGANIKAAEVEDRKRLGVILLKTSDDICYKYLESISTAEKTTRSFLGVSSLILSGAAGVTSPVESANLLSALSTASQGVEDELSNSILGGADGDLLLEAVRKGRKRQRETMANLLLGSFDTNGGEIAPDFYRFIVELSTYHDSCGISYGRQVLRNEIGEQDDDEEPTGTEVSQHKGRINPIGVKSEAPDRPTGP